MKEQQKKTIIILGIIGIVIIAICLMIQVVLKKENKKLEQESKKYETLITTTKNKEKIETEYIHVENAKFFIKVPKKFKQLTKEEINKKYTGNVPNIVFSNDESTINVAISMTDNQMKDENIKKFQQYMEELLKTNSEILESNYYQVDNHNIGQLKIISKAADTDIYNNMIYFSYNNKLVIITFNCTKDLKEEWQKVGDFIITSLFFKE